MHSLRSLLLLLMGKCDSDVLVGKFTAKDTHDVGGFVALDGFGCFEDLFEFLFIQEVAHRQVSVADVLSCAT